MINTENGNGDLSEGLTVQYITMTRSTALTVQYSYNVLDHGHLRTNNKFFPQMCMKLFLNVTISLVVINVFWDNKINSIKIDLLITLWVNCLVFKMSQHSEKWLQCP